MTAKELRELLYSVEDDSIVTFGDEEISGLELTKVYGIKEGFSYLQDVWVSLF